MKINDIIRPGIFILLSGSCLILFSGLLSHVVYYHEQHHLFLFHSDYFNQYLGRPGGLTNYLTAFIIQFFYYPLLGSLLLSLCIALVYFFNTVICGKVSGQQDRMQLSMLAPLFLLIQYATIEFPVSVLTGILLNQLLLIIYLYLPKRVQPVVLLPAIVILYFISGSYCILFIGITTFSIFFNMKRQMIWLFPLLLLCSTGLPFLGSYLYAIPVKDAVTAVFPGTFSFRPAYILFLLLLLPVPAARYFPLIYRKKEINPALYLCFSLLYMVLTAGIFYRTFDNRARIMLQADKYAKEQDWKNVLQCVQQYEGKNRLVTYLTNLALFHTGQMPDKMFGYQQVWGKESLFFPWTGNSRESEYGDLVHAGLGFLNEAHRWTFEAMTVFGQNAPILQKLVLYNIANDRPKVAMQFINVLRQSLFYRGWADDTGRAISSHQPLALHRVSDHSQPARFANLLDIGPDLLYLCDREPQNRMAFEYLMGYYLLSNQVVKFAENLWRINAFSYPDLPEAYEQALLIYKLGTSEDSFRSLNTDVRPETMERFKQYYHMVQKKADVLSIKKEFGDTYWYYLNFESPYGSKIINQE